MSEQSNTTDRLIAYLNFMLAHDRRALSDLLTTVTACGKALATNPMIEVKEVEDRSVLDSPYAVDIVDVLNGFLEEKIVLEFDDDSGLVKRIHKVV